MITQRAEFRRRNIMSRKLLYLSLAVFLMTSLVACKGKTDTETDPYSESIQETEDPFAISGDINTKIIPSQPVQETPPEETAIAEILDRGADGNASGLLANGDMFTELNVPGKLADNGKTETQVAPTTTDIPSETATGETQQGSTALETETETETEPTPTYERPAENDYEVNQSHKMSEEELINYDIVVSFWAENPDLSEEYLEEMIYNEYMFPSLTDFQRKNFIEEIKTTFPHDPAETVSYEDYFAPPPLPENQWKPTD